MLAGSVTVAVPAESGHGASGDGLGLGVGADRNGQLRYGRERTTPPEGFDVSAHCVALATVKLTVAEPPAELTGVLGPVNDPIDGLGGSAAGPT